VEVRTQQAAGEHMHERIQQQRLLVVGLGMVVLVLSTVQGLLCGVSVKATLRDVGCFACLYLHRARCACAGCASELRTACCCHTLLEQPGQLQHMPFKGMVPGNTLQTAAATMCVCTAVPPANASVALAAVVCQRALTPC
jgi:hypothetical protein